MPSELPFIPAYNHNRTRRLQVHHRIVLISRMKSWQYFISIQQMSWSFSMIIVLVRSSLGEYRRQDSQRIVQLYTVENGSPIPYIRQRYVIPNKTQNYTTQKNSTYSTRLFITKRHQNNVSCFMRNNFKRGKRFSQLICSISVEKTVGISLVIKQCVIQALVEHYSWDKSPIRPISDKNKDGV